MLVSKTVSFDAAHRLLDYPGRCAHLHGHTYMVELIVDSPDFVTVDNMSDFGFIKNLAKRAFLNEWDHATLLQDDDPLVEILAPYTDVVTFPFLPTAENMARHIANLVKCTLYELFYTFDLRSVKVWETPTSYAEWRCDSE